MPIPNPITEADIETLECYLDNALTPAQATALVNRLAADPNLAAELQTLRAQRDLRLSLFQSTEPTQTQTSALIAKINSQIARQNTKDRLTHSPFVRSARLVAAAAACIAIGFFSRSLVDRFSAPTPSLAKHPSSVKVEQIATYQVTLRDASGKILAVQQFDSPEKAREFAADVSRWQSQSQRLASGQVVLTADRF